jgi:hypothetical protein
LTERATLTAYDPSWPNVWSERCFGRAEARL